MIARCEGEDTYCVVEIDKATGAIPVSATIAIDYQGPIGQPVPTDGAFVAGQDPSGDLRGLATDVAGELQIDVLSSALPSGAATETKQDEQKVFLESIDDKTPALGQAAMAASTPVVIASDQTAIDTILSDGTHDADISPDGGLKISGTNDSVFDQGSGSTTTGSMNVHVGGIENVGNNFGDTSTSLRTASQIGNATGAADFGAGNSSAQTLRTVIATDQAAIPVTAASLPLPTGAATESKQDSAITISTNIDNKLGTLGQKTMAGSAPVVIASDQSDLPVAISAASTISVENLPATVAVDAGSHTASTIRVTEGSRSYSESALLDYSLSPVTTGAWVQVDASTAGAINLLCLTDQSGQVMELGSGAAASETRIFLIAPGFSDCIPLRIAAGVRLSVRAVSATASSGYLIISGML